MRESVRLRTLIPGCCTQAKTDTENWCGVLQEVALPGTGGDPAAFLAAAVAFANERCWGTLSCSLMVHPSTPDHAAISVLSSLPSGMKQSVTSEYAVGSPASAQVRQLELWSNFVALQPWASADFSRRQAEVTKPWEALVLEM